MNFGISLFSFVFFCYSNQNLQCGKLLFFIKQQIIFMEQTSQLILTNSELAQVESYQKLARSIFSKEFPEAKLSEQFYTQLKTIARFAIARQFKKEKAIDMWKKWVKWHEEYRPDLISASQPIIEKIHTSGKYRYIGRDHDGCPILIIRMRYHVKGLATADQNLRYLLYMIQNGKKLAEQTKTDKISIIFDRRNMAQSDQISSQSMKKFMPILNDCYPETLKAFYVIGANWFYRAMWSVVSVFISKKTQDKIHLLKEIRELKQHISANNLTEEYGGTLQMNDQTRFVPLQPQADDTEDPLKAEKIKMMLASEDK